MDAEVERARAEEGAGEGWITYLIRDPRRPDFKGNPAGIPIYVGQTNDYPKRIRTRFDKCEKEATEKDSIAKRVAKLLHLNIVVRYQVLDRQPTRLASVVSETNYARECVKRGYDIANQLAFQLSGEPNVTRYDIPVRWLGAFTLGEGIEDDIQAEICCISCGLVLRISLPKFETIQRPPTKLWEITNDRMWRTEPCTGCGRTRARFCSLYRV